MSKNINELIKITEQNLIDYNNALNSLMCSVLKYARENHIPVLLEDTAKLLFSVVENFKPKNILEIGTAIGYSGTLMLSANKSAKLTTLENFERNFNLAKTHFENENILKNVTLVFDDAFNAIQNLVNENKKFDFIFLDGPKGQYIKYLPYLKKLLCDGGILFADNVHFKGMVFLEGVIPHRKRTIVVNLRKFLQEIKNDNDFDSVELKIGDGVVIAKKIN